MSLYAGAVCGEYVPQRCWENVKLELTFKKGNVAHCNRVRLSAQAKSGSQRKLTGGTLVRAKDIVRNNVKEKLARNEVVASMTVRLVRGIEIAQIAKTAGFDMLYIDNEHSSFSLDTTGQICLAALNAGIVPMVRVPSNAPGHVSRVLDGGALGIIAPHIESAEEARTVVKAAKFPPLG
jgi:hypothetical protein